MAANFIPSFAKQSGRAESEVEKMWHEAEKLAKEAKPKPDDVEAYAVGILKKMLKLNEGFKEYIGSAGAFKNFKE